MKRCKYCRGRIWPWQSFGREVLWNGLLPESMGGIRHWHSKCRPFQRVAS